MMPVRRSARELPCEREQVEGVSLLERFLTDPVLLGMVTPTKA